MKFCLALVAVSACVTFLLLLLASPAEADYVCETEWWWLSDQRVKVRNPRWGNTKVWIHFDEVYWSNGKDRVRWQTTKDSHSSTRKGWLQVFSDNKRYKVIKNSVFDLVKTEGGAWEHNKRNIKGRFETGFNRVEEGDVRYEYTITKGAGCYKG